MLFRSLFGGVFIIIINHLRANDELCAFVFVLWIRKKFEVEVDVVREETFVIGFFFIVLFGEAESNTLLFLVLTLYDSVYTLKLSWVKFLEESRSFSKPFLSFDLLTHQCLDPFAAQS